MIHRLQCFFCHQNLNKINLLLCSLIVLLLASCGELQKPSTDWNSLSPIVQKALKEFKVPGCAITIVHKGQIVFMKGFGYRNVEQKLPVTPETQFAIGSCSKAFTATALGILVDQKKLSWDTPIKKYIKDLVLYDKTLTNNISVRDCLLHRTGLPSHGGDFIGGLNLVTNQQDLIDKLRYIKPEVPFRSQMLYNNCMYVLAGVVVEHITGKTWAEFTTTQIFKPLNMRNSYCSVKDIDLNGNVALPYELNEKTKLLKNIEYDDIAIVGPAGSIISTAEDMAQWLLFNLDSIAPEKAIISQETLQEIHRPQIKMEGSVPGVKYAFGWGVKEIDGLLGHEGSFDGFLACVSFNINKDFGIVILTNSSGNHASAFVNTIQKEAFALLNKQDYKQLPPEMYHAFIGTYNHDAFGTITISQKDKSLICSWGSYQTPLRHVENFQFISTAKSKGFDPEKLRCTFDYDENKKTATSLRIQIIDTDCDEVFRKNG